MTPEDEEQEDQESFKRNPLALKILGDDDKAGYMVTPRTNHFNVSTYRIKQWPIMPEYR